MLSGKITSMETPPTRPATPRELPILGGHLALDFANTVDDPLGPARHDHAATYPDLLQWATRVNLVGEQQAARLLRAAARAPRTEAAALRRAHQLRRAVNELFGGVADDRPDVPDQWPRLRPFVTAAIAAASLATADGVEPAGRARGRQAWVWPQEDELHVMLYPIAMAAAELLVGPDLSRLKRCARCPWLFLDRSKNHSRRWCDMDDCGKAQKIERYVARRAARRSWAQQAIGSQRA